MHKATELHQSACLHTPDLFLDGRAVLCIRARLADEGTPESQDEWSQSGLRTMEGALSSQHSGTYLSRGNTGDFGTF